MYRSLAWPSKRFQNTASIAKCIQECAADSAFQGIELCSSHLSKDVLEQCLASKVQVLCRVMPKDVDDSFRIFDALSSELSRMEANAVGEALRLIVLEEPMTANTNKLEYLFDALPLAAKFMETHPTIGQSKGELNAHGNPLDDHVLGVCHRLRFPQPPAIADEPPVSSSKRGALLEEILGILDVLPPTRLSLDARTTLQLDNDMQNELSGSDINNSTNGSSEDTVDGWDIEPLIQGIDHFDFAGWKPGKFSPNSLHHKVWKWQNEIQVKESYVSCDDPAIAKSLQENFQNVK